MALTETSRRGAKNAPLESDVLADVRRPPFDCLPTRRAIRYQYAIPITSEICSPGLPPEHCEPAVKAMPIDS